MATLCQVSVTAASAEEAACLGTAAVEARLAACAQVSGPIASTYRWQGEIESAQEWLCVLKTTEALVAPLMEQLRAAHSYDTPEIIATLVDHADPDYALWVEAQTLG
ncbi:MAG: divalent-cation tolerance protein CutA [Acidimicrobiales bacterium]|jgi:periplasmic divalent cation tolerance protein